MTATAKATPRTPALATAALTGTPQEAAARIMELIRTRRIGLYEMHAIASTTGHVLRGHDKLTATVTLTERRDGVRVKRHDGTGIAPFPSGVVAQDGRYYGIRSASVSHRPGMSFPGDGPYVVQLVDEGQSFGRVVWESAEVFPFSALRSHGVDAGLKFPRPAMRQCEA